MEKELNSGKYILPTAAGTYHLACQKREETPASLLFAKIFENKRLSKLSEKDMQQIMGLNDNDFAAQMQEIRSMGWIEEYDEVLELPENSAEEILPQLLSMLSSEGQALVADEHGFPLFYTGMSAEASEAFAVMTADLTAIYSKYESTYGTEMLPSQAWGMIDAGGHCQMGVWPLQLGKHRFNLFVKGLPKLDHPNFILLVWMLYSRYYDD